MTNAVCVHKTTKVLFDALPTGHQNDSFLYKLFLVVDKKTKAFVQLFIF